MKRRKGPDKPTLLGGDGMFWGTTRRKGGARKEGGVTGSRRGHSSDTTPLYQAEVGYTFRPDLEWLRLAIKCRLPG